MWLKEQSDTEDSMNLLSTVLIAWRELSLEVLEDIFGIKSDNHLILLVVY